MEIKNKKASLMTPSCEFVKVKIKGAVPEIGSTYTGSSVNKMPFCKYAVVAASLLIFISTGGVAYAYYTPTAAITLNDDLQIKLNRWNKIIKTLPLTKEGESLLHSSDIKNKNINDGLNVLTEKSKESTNEISLQVTSNTNKPLDLSKFEDSSKEENLNVIINYNKNNSTNSKKVGIIEDNSKNEDAIETKTPNTTNNPNKANKTKKPNNANKTKKNTIGSKVNDKNKKKPPYPNNPSIDRKKNKNKNKNKSNKLDKTLNSNKKDLRAKLKNNSSKKVKPSKTSNNKAQGDSKNTKKNSKKDSNNHKSK